MCESLAKQTPLLSRGGVDATSIKCREASFDGADGVVVVNKISGRGPTPPRLRGNKVASLFFIDRAATPPRLRRGVRSTIGNDSHIQLLSGHTGDRKCLRQQE